jgi:hypothetical protein
MKHKGDLQINALFGHHRASRHVLRCGMGGNKLPIVYTVCSIYRLGWHSEANWLIHGIKHAYSNANATYAFTEWITP